MKYCLLLIVLTSLITFSGCDFLRNAYEFRDTTEKFAEAILNENYDEGMELFAMDHEIASTANPDSLKSGLARFRSLILEHFGADLEYTFMKTEKKWSTVEDANTPPNTTVLLMQFSNDTHFGVFKVLFDDVSKKIMNIKMLDVKQPIPNMFFFWLFGALAICVPIFNIYVILLIRKSDLKRKWLKYIAVLVFNVPAITYTAVSGLSFNLFSFQILLGISFSYMGYLNAAWTFGIPLGGLFWLWQIKMRGQEPDLAMGQSTELTGDMD